MTEILVREWCEPMELRARTEWGTPGRVLSGHFSVFNRFTKIDSQREGRFLEQVAPGAFDRSIAEAPDRIRALYQHGQDPTVAMKPLGPWRSWRDGQGQAYEVDLIRTDYNDNFIMPAAEAKVLGASFRFSVNGDNGDAVDHPMRPTKWNPDRLPERTLLDVNLYDIGPVTYGAYPDAGQGLRSLTDDYYDRLLNDPLFLARFTERVGLKVVERILAEAPDGVRAEDESTTPEVTADGEARDNRQTIRDLLAGLPFIKE